ncbi:MAG: hypothetical protein ACKO8Q_06810, partial [Bacteroidota bacterium]
MLPFGLNAQLVNCDNFSVLGIGTDISNSQTSVVHIQMLGNASDFIDYPAISTVTDCNGDTVATGGLFFFGQLGQSVQSYPVAGSLLNACLPLSIEFVYGNSNGQADTCMLTFNSIVPPVNCVDMSITQIQVDQSNSLFSIALQGSNNTFISNSQITTVTDCNGAVVATGFAGTSGQLGLTTQGYPTTPLSGNICY